MARKPILFRPQLVTPQGLNNYPGDLFRCFTMGDTLPFKFTFTNEDGSVMDVNGCQVKIAFGPELDTVNESEFDIPLVDLAEGIFEGDVTSTNTKTLTPGVNYAVAKYADVGGREYIIDMCILEVYRNL